MSRPREPHVSARVAGPILRAAAARGADPAAVAARAGFDRAQLADPDASIPLAQETALWEAAAAATGDGDLGLHAAEAIERGEFDVIDYAVRTASCVREALARLARYNRLVHDLAVFELTDTARGVEIAHRFDAPGLAPSRHASEFTLASVLVVAGQATGAPMLALRVEFAHPEPASTSEHERVFGVRPRFGASASLLALSRESASRAVLAADAGLSRIVTAHADALLEARRPHPPGASDRVRHCLAEGFAHGPPPLAQVAKRLHTSGRSLQRRLREEGTCFADVVDGFRRELALRYVADPKLALGEVAYLLGFAEPSPFHRAFRRWTGTTPAAMRRAAR
jgi:AraC-like DNA-binding protein